MQQSVAQEAVFSSRVGGSRGNFFSPLCAQGDISRSGMIIVFKRETTYISIRELRNDCLRVLHMHTGCHVQSVSLGASFHPKINQRASVDKIFN